ncbi:hypothetical protein Lser_V15G28644 [Lactuca serriola]
MLRSGKWIYYMDPFEPLKYQEPLATLKATIEKEGSKVVLASLIEKYILNNTHLVIIEMQAVCLAACKKLQEMGAFNNMLFPYKGSWGVAKNIDENDEGVMFPRTTRHREFYPEGVAKILQGVIDGCIELNETQLDSLKSFHVRLMNIVLDVDVEPSTTPWDPIYAYLFVLVSADMIDWDTVENIIKTPAWNNPLQIARADDYLGTNERTLGGDRRKYGYGKLRHGMGMALIMMIILK